MGQQRLHSMTDHHPSWKSSHFKSSENGGFGGAGTAAAILEKN